MRMRGRTGQGVEVGQLLLRCLQLLYRIGQRRSLLLLPRLGGRSIWSRGLRAAHVAEEESGLCKRPRGQRTPVPAARMHDQQSSAQHRSAQHSGRLPSRAEAGMRPHRSVESQSSARRSSAAISSLMARLAHLTVAICSSDSA